jgi:glycosyltransferase involved in cell wall biosynthesis
MPHVSVIIPVFNSAHLIGGALRSVFAQTFLDLEVIVVDDGSNDAEALIAALAEWPDVRYIRQSNGGPASARNTGITHAQGDLVAFLDADDEWLSDKLERQVDYFSRYPSTGLLHTGVVGQVSGGAEAGPPRNAFCDLYHTTFFIKTLTVAVPRRVLADVGGFDERREIHVEDWDLWLRIAARYDLGYLPEPLAVHRPGGLMSRHVERTYIAQGLVIDKSQDLCALACPRHRDAPARCERERRYVLHREWGYDRLVAGDRKGARDQFARALCHAPAQPRTALLYLSTFVSERLHDVVRTRPIERQEDTSNAYSAPSLVHDTIYRRCRKRVIATLHDLDDRISRSSRSDRRILFDAASPVSFAVFRSIYERLRQDSRLELWFTSHGVVWQAQEIFGPAGIRDNIVSRRTAARMKVDACLNADFWDMTWVYRRTRRVHLFHGVAGKYGLDAPVDLAPTIAAFDCLMFANADRRRRYIEAGLVPDELPKAALVGYPKTDCLVDGTLDRTDVLRSLGFDPDTPTIIYAPTWSPYSSLNASGEDIIDRLAAEGLQVIVKLHDRSYDRRQRGSGGIDWAGRLAKYDGHPLVRIARDADGAPYLVASDLMISDHSSIAFEYMLLDRPLVVVDCPELIQRAAISADKVRRLHTASDVVADVDGLIAGVARGLQTPGAFSTERRRTAGELFFKPGSATDRALDLIYALVNLPRLDPVVSPATSPPAFAVAG